MPPCQASLFSAARFDQRFSPEVSVCVSTGLIERRFSPARVGVCATVKNLRSALFVHPAAFFVLVCFHLACPRPYHNSKPSFRFRSWRFRRRATTRRQDDPQLLPAFRREGQGNEARAVHADAAPGPGHGRLLRCRVGQDWTHPVAGRYLFHSIHPTSTAELQPNLAALKGYLPTS